VAVQTPLDRHGPSALAMTVGGSAPRDDGVGAALAMTVLGRPWRWRCWGGPPDDGVGAALAMMAEPVTARPLSLRGRRPRQTGLV